MAVPEAAMNKYSRFVFGQNNVRFSRQLFIMQAVAKTFAEQKFPDQYFRFCILTPDTGHIIASGFF